MEKLRWEQVATDLGSFSPELSLAQASGSEAENSGFQTV